MNEIHVHTSLFRSKYGPSAITQSIRFYQNRTMVFELCMAKYHIAEAEHQKQIKTNKSEYHWGAFQFGLISNQQIKWFLHEYYSHYCKKRDT